MSDASRTTALPRTTTDFVVWPGDGRARHYELVDGDVRAMAPASPAHGLIQATLAGMIRQHLRDTKSPCRVLVSAGVVPRVRANDNFRIPDLVVTCSAIEPGPAMVPEPVLAVKILSPGNAAETWQNVGSFCTIPSLREILVVDSTRVEARLLRRLPDGSWPDVPVDLGAEATVELASVAFGCPVRDIYEGTPLA